jgi:hypothetical protein
LETKFLANLEPFILAGAFKKPPATIPEPIIKKLVTYYEQRHEYKALEKVIMKVDVSDFVYLREELLVVCQVHCLIGALLHLMSSQKVNTDDQVRALPFNSCVFMRRVSTMEAVNRS